MSSKASQISEVSEASKTDVTNALSDPEIFTTAGLVRDRHTEYEHTCCAETIVLERKSATLGSTLHAIAAGEPCGARISQSARALLFHRLPMEGLPRSQLPGYRRRTAYAGLLAHAETLSGVAVDSVQPVNTRPMEGSVAELKSCIADWRHSRTTGRTRLQDFITATESKKAPLSSSAAFAKARQLVALFTKGITAIQMFCIDSGFRVPTFDPWRNAPSKGRVSRFPHVDDLGTNLAVLHLNRCRVHLIVACTVWGNKQVSSAPFRTRRMLCALNDALAALSFCPYYARAWEALLDTLDRLGAGLAAAAAASVPRAVSPPRVPPAAAAGGGGAATATTAAAPEADTARVASCLQRFHEIINTTLWQWVLAQQSQPPSAAFPLRITKSGASELQELLESREQQVVAKLLKSGDWALSADPKYGRDALLSVGAFSTPDSWLDGFLPLSARVTLNTSVPYEAGVGTDPLLGFTRVVDASPGTLLKCLFPTWTAVHRCLDNTRVRSAPSQLVTWLSAVKTRMHSGPCEYRDDDYPLTWAFANGVAHDEESVKSTNHGDADHRCARVEQFLRIMFPPVLLWEVCDGDSAEHVAVRGFLRADFHADHLRGALIGTTLPSLCAALPKHVGALWAQTSVMSLLWDVYDRGEKERFLRVYDTIADLLDDASLNWTLSVKLGMAELPRYEGEIAVPEDLLADHDNPEDLAEARNIAMTNARIQAGAALRERTNTGFMTAFAGVREGKPRLVRAGIALAQHPDDLDSDVHPLWHDSARFSFCTTAAFVPIQWYRWPQTNDTLLHELARWLCPLIPALAFSATKRDGIRVVPRGASLCPSVEAADAMLCAIIDVDVVTAARLVARELVSRTTANSSLGGMIHLEEYFLDAPCECLSTALRAENSAGVMPLTLLLRLWAAAAREEIATVSSGCLHASAAGGEAVFHKAAGGTSSGGSSSGGSPHASSNEHDSKSSPAIVDAVLPAAHWPHPALQVNSFDAMAHVAVFFLSIPGVPRTRLAVNGVDVLLNELTALADAACSSGRPHPSARRFRDNVRRVVDAFTYCVDAFTYCVDEDGDEDVQNRVFSQRLSRVSSSSVCALPVTDILQHLWSLDVPSVPAVHSSRGRVLGEEPRGSTLSIPHTRGLSMWREAEAAVEQCFEPVYDHVAAAYAVYSRSEPDFFEFVMTDTSLLSLPGMVPGMLRYTRKLPDLAGGGGSTVLWQEYRRTSLWQSFCDELSRAEKERTSGNVCSGDTYAPNSRLLSNSLEALGGIMPLAVTTGMSASSALPHLPPRCAEVRGLLVPAMYSVMLTVTLPGVDSTAASNIHTLSVPDSTTTASHTSGATMPFPRLFEWFYARELAAWVSDARAAQRRPTCFAPWWEEFRRALACPGSDSARFLLSRNLVALPSLDVGSASSRFRLPISCLNSAESVAREWPALIKSMNIEHLLPDLLPVVVPIEVYRGVVELLMTDIHDLFRDKYTSFEDYGLSEKLKLAEITANVLFDYDYHDVNDLDWATPYILSREPVRALAWCCRLFPTHFRNRSLIDAIVELWCELNASESELLLPVVSEESVSKLDLCAAALEALRRDPAVDQDDDRYASIVLVASKCVIALALDKYRTSEDYESTMRNGRPLFIIDSLGERYSHSVTGSQLRASLSGVDVSSAAPSAAPAPSAASVTAAAAPPVSSAASVTAAAPPVSSAASVTAAAAPPVSSVTAASAAAAAEDVAVAAAEDVSAAEAAEGTAGWAAAQQAATAARADAPVARQATSKVAMATISGVAAEGKAASGAAFNEAVKDGGAVVLPPLSTSAASSPAESTQSRAALDAVPTPSCPPDSVITLQAVVDSAATPPAVSLVDSDGVTELGSAPPVSDTAAASSPSSVARGESVLLTISGDMAASLTESDSTHPAAAMSPPAADPPTSTSNAAAATSPSAPTTKQSTASKKKTSVDAKQQQQQRTAPASPSESAPSPVAAPSNSMSDGPVFKISSALSSSRSSAGEGAAADAPSASTAVTGNAAKRVLAEARAAARQCAQEYIAASAAAKATPQSAAASATSPNPFDEDGTEAVLFSTVDELDAAAAAATAFTASAAEVADATASSVSAQAAPVHTIIRAVRPPADAFTTLMHALANDLHAHVVSGGSNSSYVPSPTHIQELQARFHHLSQVFASGGCSAAAAGAAVLGEMEQQLLSLQNRCYGAMQKRLRSMLPQWPGHDDVEDAAAAEGAIGGSLSAMRASSAAAAPRMYSDSDDDRAPLSVPQGSVGVLSLIDNVLTSCASPSALVFVPATYAARSYFRVYSLADACDGESTAQLSPAAITAFVRSRANYPANLIALAPVLCDKLRMFANGLFDAEGRNDAELAHALSWLRRLDVIAEVFVLQTACGHTMDIAYMHSDIVRRAALHEHEPAVRRLLAPDGRITIDGRWTRVLSPYSAGFSAAALMLHLLCASCYDGADDTGGVSTSADVVGAVTGGGGPRWIPPLLLPAMSNALLATLEPAVRTRTAPVRSSIGTAADTAAAAAAAAVPDVSQVSLPLACDLLERVTLPLLLAAQALHYQRSHAAFTAAALTSSMEGMAVALATQAEAGDPSSISGSTGGGGGGSPSPLSQSPSQQQLSAPADIPLTHSLVTLDIFIARHLHLGEYAAASGLKRVTCTAARCADGTAPPPLRAIHALLAHSHSTAFAAAVVEASLQRVVQVAGAMVERLVAIRCASKRKQPGSSSGSSSGGGGSDHYTPAEIIELLPASLKAGGESLAGGVGITVNDAIAWTRLLALMSTLCSCSSVRYMPSTVLNPAARLGCLLALGKEKPTDSFVRSTAYQLSRCREALSCSVAGVTTLAVRSPSAEALAQLFPTPSAPSTSSPLTTVVAPDDEATVGHRVVRALKLLTDDQPPIPVTFSVVPLPQVREFVDFLRAHTVAVDEHVAHASRVRRVLFPSSSSSERSPAAGSVSASSPPAVPWPVLSLPPSGGSVGEGDVSPPGAVPSSAPEHLLPELCTSAEDGSISLADAPLGASSSLQWVELLRDPRWFGSLAWCSAFAQAMQHVPPWPVMGSEKAGDVMLAGRTSSPAAMLQGTLSRSQIADDTLVALRAAAATAAAAAAASAVAATPQQQRASPPLLHDSGRAASTSSVDSTDRRLATAASNAARITIFSDGGSPAVVSNGSGGGGDVANIGAGGGGRSGMGLIARPRVHVVVANHQQQQPQQQQQQQRNSAGGGAAQAMQLELAFGLSSASSPSSHSSPWGASSVGHVSRGHTPATAAAAASSASEHATQRLNVVTQAQQQQLQRGRASESRRSSTEDVANAVGEAVLSSMGMDDEDEEAAAPSSSSSSSFLGPSLLPQSRGGAAFTHEPSSSDLQLSSGVPSLASFQSGPGALNHAAAGGSEASTAGAGGDGGRSSLLRTGPPAPDGSLLGPAAAHRSSSMGPPSRTATTTAGGGAPASSSIAPPAPAAGNVFSSLLQLARRPGVAGSAAATRSAGAGSAPRTTSASASQGTANAEEEAEERGSSSAAVGSRGASSDVVVGTAGASSAIAARQERVEAARQRIAARLLSEQQSRLLSAQSAASASARHRGGAIVTAAPDKWRFEENVWSESLHCGSYYLYVLDAAGLDISAERGVGADVESALTALDELLTTALPPRIAAIRKARAVKWYASSKARAATRQAAEAAPIQAVMRSAMQKALARVPQLPAGTLAGTSTSESWSCPTCGVTVRSSSPTPTLTLNGEAVTLRAAHERVCRTRRTSCARLEACVVAPLRLQLQLRLAAAASLLAKQKAALAAVEALGTGGGRGCLTKGAIDLIRARRDALEARLAAVVEASASLTPVLIQLGDELLRSDACNWLTVEIDLSGSSSSSGGGPGSNPSSSSSSSSTSSVLTAVPVRPVRPRDIRVRLEAAASVQESHQRHTVDSLGSTLSASVLSRTLREDMLTQEEDEASSTHPLPRLLRAALEAEALLHTQLHPLLFCLEEEAAHIPALMGGSVRLSSVKKVQNTCRIAKREEEKKLSRLTARPPSSDAPDGNASARPAGAAGAAAAAFPNPRLATLGAIPGLLPVTGAAARGGGSAGSAGAGDLGADDSWNNSWSEARRRAPRR